MRFATIFLTNFRFFLAALYNFLWLVPSFYFCRKNLRFISGFLHKQPTNFRTHSELFELLLASEFVHFPGSKFILGFLEKAELFHLISCSLQFVFSSAEYISTLLVLAFPKLWAFLFSLSEPLIPAHPNLCSFYLLANLLDPDSLLKLFCTWSQNLFSKLTLEGWAFQLKFIFHPNLLTNLFLFILSTKLAALKPPFLFTTA